MEEVLGRGFGLCIAFVVPGLVALWGASFIEPSIGIWLAVASQGGPTVGSFLFVLLGSITAGLTASAVRWVVVDSIHHWTGIEPPRWRLCVLQENLDAYQVLVEYHYRHYQFYANTLVSGAFALGARAVSHGIRVGSFWMIIGWAALAVVFFAASRDTLRKYYSRVAELLSAGKGHGHGERRSCA